MQEKKENIAPIKERIFQYIDSKHIKKIEFYDRVGLNASNFKTSALKSELGSDKVSRILTSYPDISPQWLLTGEGPMLKNNPKLKIREVRESKGLTIVDLAQKLNVDPSVISKIEDNPNYTVAAETYAAVAHALNVGINDLLSDSALKLGIPVGTDKKPYIGPTGNEFKDLENGKYKVSVPLVPAYAYAQYLTDYEADDLKERFEYVDFVVDMIGKGKYYAFEIKGDSMDDDSKRSIPDGSTVLARDVKKEYWMDKLHYKKFPYWIIVHQNSILCKQIIDHDVEKGKIKCHSLNDSPEYTDFEIDLREVRQLLNIVKVQQDIKYF